MNISFLSFSFFCSIFKSPFNEACRSPLRCPLILLNCRVEDFVVVNFYRTVNKTLLLKNLDDPVGEYDVGQTQQISALFHCFQALEMEAIDLFGS